MLLDPPVFGRGALRLVERDRFRYLKLKIGGGPLREQSVTVEQYHGPVVVPAQLERALEWGRQPQRDHGAPTGEELGDQPAGVAALDRVRRPAKARVNEDSATRRGDIRWALATWLGLFGSSVHDSGRSRSTELLASTEPTTPACELASGGHLVSTRAVSETELSELPDDLVAKGVGLVEWLVGDPVERVQLSAVRVDRLELLGARPRGQCVDGRRAERPIDRGKRLFPVDLRSACRPSSRAVVDVSRPAVADRVRQLGAERHREAVLAQRQRGGADEQMIWMPADSGRRQQRRGGREPVPQLGQDMTERLAGRRGTGRRGTRG